MLALPSSYQDHDGDPYDGMSPLCIRHGQILLDMERRVSDVETRSYETAVALAGLVGKMSVMVMGVSGIVSLGVALIILWLRTAVGG